MFHYLFTSLDQKREVHMPNILPEIKQLNIENISQEGNNLTENKTIRNYKKIKCKLHKMYVIIIL